MRSVSTTRLDNRNTTIVVLSVLAIAAIVTAVSINAPETQASGNHTISDTSTTSLGSNQSISSPLIHGAGSFRNYTQLNEFVAANAKSAQEYANNGNWFGGPVMGFAPTVTMSAVSETVMTTVATAADSIQTTPSYTGTNVQVQGVDEPDWVKTDGLHIFVSTATAVTIINAYPPNSTKILSTISLPGGNIQGIDIAQNRLIVFNQRTTNTTYTDLLLYNTSNLASPKLIENMSIAGNYVSARLTGGYVYEIIQQPAYQFNSSGNATGVLPVVNNNGATTILPPSSVYYTKDGAQITYYTMVVSMSVSTGQVSTFSVLTGPSSTIYVSTSNIYVVYTQYMSYYADADGIPGDAFTGGVISSNVVPQDQNSTIFRAAYSNGTILWEAVGTVPGTVLNQFSMDEYNNYFRVATSGLATINGSGTRSDDVYVLNMNMSIVAGLVNIAPGENLYAVSFVGDVGYVVTFEQVDPLFVISFQNITKPTIESALKMNGFSDYLYPLPNGYLIGVGKDSVPSSTGDFAYFLGLKLSLFKVFSNGSSTQISKFQIGDRGTDSPVLTDHLAFTYDPAKNIMVLPVLLAQVSGNSSYVSGSPPPFGDYVWQGAYVFQVNSTGFTLLGRVSQYPSSLNYTDSQTNNLDIGRSIIIGNDLYTISQGEVMVSDLSSFGTLATIPLPGS